MRLWRRRVPDGYLWLWGEDGGAAIRVPLVECGDELLNRRDVVIGHRAIQTAWLDVPDGRQRGLVAAQVIGDAEDGRIAAGGLVFRREPRATNPLDPRVSAEKREEPVVGYRCWYCASGRLDSVGVSHTWEPGENVASKRGGAPGFWVLRTLEDASLAADSYAAVIVGVVQGYGRVVEHRRGWRCQYARVVALSRRLAFADTVSDDALAAPWGASEELMAHLGDFYRVPTVPLDSLGLVGEEMGAEKAK